MMPIHPFGLGFDIAAPGDEHAHPAQTAGAAPFAEFSRRKGENNGKSRIWAVEQALKTLEERGFRAPPEDRLENYLRRSRKPRKRVPR
jgi:hypothetical protein